MEKIRSRKKLLLYGCSGIGVNMMNLMMGTYLCSALLTGGFGEHLESWTFLGVDLVIPAVWTFIGFFAKVLDGLIDLPFASFTDRLKTRWGRRRPSLMIGFVPMVIAYLLFLWAPTPGESLINTIWFGALLCIFYAFYTLTMLTFYATFSEVCENEQDTIFLSNTKSICDVVYFSLGYALIPVFISLNINIRYVALIFLPLSLSMMIPLFLLKEKPTNVPDEDGTRTVRELTLGEALGASFKNRDLILWLFTSAVTNIGLQLFLTGINELFSSTGLNMTVVMASSFAPVPLTIALYNRIVKRRGFGVGYRYVLTIYAIGMLVMYFCNINSHNMSELALTLVALFGGIFVSFSLGAFFSVTYTVPSYLAQREFERSGKSVASMYFAVEGVFSAVSSGIASSLILVPLKGTAEKTYISWLPIVVMGACALAFGLSFLFPRAIALLGKKDK